MKVQIEKGNAATAIFFSFLFLTLKWGNANVIFEACEERRCSSDLLNATAIC
jgi:hypothetical protein